MKTCLAVSAMVLFLTSLAPAQQPGTPTKLGVPAELKKYNVTIRRFDPHQGYDNGENFVLPVDSIDEDHAIASTLANAVSWTTKVQGGTVLPVAFCCVAVEERK